MTEPRVPFYLAELLPDDQVLVYGRLVQVVEVVLPKDAPKLAELTCRRVVDGAVADAPTLVWMARAELVLGVRVIRPYQAYCRSCDMWTPYAADAAKGNPYVGVCGGCHAIIHRELMEPDA